MMKLEKSLNTPPDNWPKEWTNWLDLLKVECLLALGEDKQATNILANLENNFSSNFIRSETTNFTW